MAKNKYAVPKRAITEKGLKRLLRDAGRKHSSMSEWSSVHNITPQSVSAFMRKLEGPGLKIPEALGYRPQTVFIPIDEPLISTMLPPRRPTARPSKKVDHTKPPLTRSGPPVDDRAETKKKLKNRKK